MSMIVNMTEQTQRNSDNEGSQTEEDLRALDKYSNKGRSRDGSPEERQSSATTKTRYELSSFEGTNALLDMLYAMGDWTAAKQQAQALIGKFDGRCEYAYYIHGLISRQEGDMVRARLDFEAALQASNGDPKYLVQLGRVHFLMGENVKAVECLEKAVKTDPTNTKAYYWLARAVYFLDNNLFNTKEKARDILLQAPMIKHSSELLFYLAQLQQELQEYDTAIQAYQKASELEPENLDIIFRLGMLYLKMDDEDRSFAVFGNALSYDPAHIQTILSIGSIMQNHGDHDVALNKYRVATDLCDYNGCLWNNVGICLFSKGKLAAAHSVLKKALFIAPLDYKINYNLGLVHQAMGLNCSALHYLKAAAELKKNDPHILGAMAVVFSNMGDDKNSRRAYNRSIELDPKPHVIVNYAIFEANQKNTEAAMAALQQFKTVATEQGCRQEVLALADDLEEKLKKPIIDKEPSDD